MKLQISIVWSSILLGLFQLPAVGRFTPEDIEQTGCTVVGAFTVYNATEEVLAVSLVQTKFTLNPVTRYAELYTEEQAGPKDDLKIAVIPPGYSIDFDNCKNGGIVYDRTIWFSSDATKLCKAIADGTRKALKNYVMQEKIASDSGALYIVANGSKLKAVKTVGENALAALKDLSESSKLEAAVLSFSDGDGAINREFQNQRKVLHDKVAKNKLLIALIAHIHQVKTIKDWETSFVKTSGEKGFAAIKKLLAKSKTQPSDLQLKSVRNAYEIMVLRILSSLEPSISTRIKELMCKPQNAPDTCTKDMLSLVELFFRQIKTHLIKPIIAVTGYPPYERSDMPERLAFSDGREEAFVQGFKKIMDSLVVIWKEAWGKWSQSVKSAPRADLDKIIAQLNVVFETSKEDVPKNTTGNFPWIAELEDIMQEAITHSLDGSS